MRKSCCNWWRLALIAGLIPMALSAQAGRDPIQLKNWTAPQYYQRSHTEASSTSTAPLVFVAIPPCRLADTRAGSGYPALGSSPLASLTPQTLSIAGSCGTPTSTVALAYSLNVTVVPPASTPGGYLTVYPNPVSPVPSAASLTWIAGAAYDTNAVVAESSSDGSVNVVARFPTDVVVDINGYYVAQTGHAASLVFNSSSLTAYPPAAASTVLSTTLSSSAGVLPATAWALQSSSVINLMLTFNVPIDFSATAGTPVVHIHFLTGPTSTVSGTVNLNLYFCDAPAVTNVSGACFVTYANSVTASDAVSNSSVYTFNHYDLTYTLSGYSVAGHGIGAGDFVAITIGRPTDSFGDVIYVTSVEFRYQTN